MAFCVAFKRFSNRTQDPTRAGPLALGLLSPPSVALSQLPLLLASFIGAAARNPMPLKTPTSMPVSMLVLPSNLPIISSPISAQSSSANARRALSTYAVRRSPSIAPSSCLPGIRSHPTTSYFSQLAVITVEPSDEIEVIRRDFSDTHPVRLTRQSPRDRIGNQAIPRAVKSRAGWRCWAASRGGLPLNLAMDTLEAGMELSVPKSLD